MHFELCTKGEASLFFIWPSQVTRNVWENIKLLILKFTFKVNSELQEIDLYKELNLFGKIVSQQTSGPDVLKICILKQFTWNIFQYYHSLQNIISFRNS